MKKFLTTVIAAAGMIAQIWGLEAAEMNKVSVIEFMKAVDVLKNGASVSRGCDSSSSSSSCSSSSSSDFSTCCRGLFNETLILATDGESIDDVVTWNVALGATNDWKLSRIGRTGQLKSRHSGLFLVAFLEDGELVSQPFLTVEGISTGLFPVGFFPGLNVWATIVEIEKNDVVSFSIPGDATLNTSIAAFVLLDDSFPRVSSVE